MNSRERRKQEAAEHNANRVDMKAPVPKPGTTDGLQVRDLDDMLELTEFDTETGRVLKQYHSILNGRKHSVLDATPYSLDIHNDIVEEFCRQKARQEFIKQCKEMIVLPTIITGG